jgi:diguanylate cyclase (GGDEF)-like protein
MPVAQAQTLLQILRQAEALTRIRCQEELFRRVTADALGLLQARTAMLSQVRYGLAGGPELIPVGWCATDGDESHWEPCVGQDTPLAPDPFLAACLAGAKPRQRKMGNDDWRIAFPVGMEEIRWLLELRAPLRAGPILLQGIALFLLCFENQMRQWDYANLDTLTRLLNRKTFDEQFDQLILEAERAQRLSDDRRIDEFQGNRPCWLAVADIDHFKRVNDGFGHLFGDEVLLLVANIMRKSFRGGDKLFRFGGEEFVVMLRNASEEDVGQIFERFRSAVAQWDFPQVGKVTCSVGYARIDPSRSPAELLGRADEALYYAKDHGRNQVRNFDELVKRGELQLAASPASEAQADADALFE